MDSVVIALAAALLYLIAYHTYGKFLAKKIFKIDNSLSTPANLINDKTDFVPTKKEILFGHHYTSIAGTGPIVGPAIGIIWGWLPALLWIIFGSIFMGAVHDFGALVVSMRNQGRSIGDIAADLISKRVRMIFLAIIFLELLIVIAIFCLVIAILFELYPEAVLSIWLQVPIAIWLGYMIYKRGKSSLWYSLLGLVLLYAAIYAGTFLPLELGSLGPAGPIVIWSVILLIYVFFASVLPVTTLLQPRDYINGHQLLVIMGLLALSVLFARPEIVAPAVNLHPAGAPPIWPYLFITIACGAISGFHSLVSSGTTSKQISREGDAQTIGYGGMLLEGMLAIFVLIAVAGGIGLLDNNLGHSGLQAWRDHYSSWGAAKGLADKVGAFVTGAGNMLTYLGIPLTLGVTIMGVFVASFAGTTIDTATRLQRYAISEFGKGIGVKALGNKYVATAIAVITAGALALSDGKGQGGLILWPLFGATNQLLAALALLVITVYLARQGRPLGYTLIPFLLMLVMTGWAMLSNIKMFYTDFTASHAQVYPLVISIIIMVLEAWMVIEAALVMLKTRKNFPAA